ncbi:MAG: hypothetical protein ABI193_07810 [Minicystis sp.]
MFRSDRDALAQEVEDLRHEQERLRLENEAMAREIVVRRRDAPGLPSGLNLYKVGVGHLSAGEQAALQRHSLTTFPAWAAVLLHFVTFGLFPLIHFGLQHDRLPLVEKDDPSAGKAIGFTFIPYFNLYWIVFNTLRLTDRVNLQFRLRGQPDAVPRAFIAVASVIGVIPYLNILLGWTVFWPIVIFYLQRAVNELAADREATAEGRSVEAGSRFESMPMRVPLVGDLPGPDPVLELEDEAEEEAEMTRERALRGASGG